MREIVVIQAFEEHGCLLSGFRLGGGDLAVDIIHVQLAREINGRHRRSPPEQTREEPALRRLRRLNFTACVVAVAPL
ncbi:hypothetical protein [Microbacterium aurantiacum]|uniref:hypothetical protein n=1 Tax=Microbacterium aurantiacum TaxID=162393 RepID=UPI003D74C86B